jgi:flagellum-specific peptidoglycan hydrolase FlgJ
VQRTDDYEWDRFEVYPSARESYRRHSLLLQGPRYSWMIRQYEIGEEYPIARKLYGKTLVPYYAAWCVGLKQSGYATAKNYAEMITMIIETYQLWKIDYELIMA